MPETNDTRPSGALAGKTSEFRDRIVALGALLAPDESNNVRIARIAALLGASESGVRKWFYGFAAPVGVARSLLLDRVEREIADRERR